MTAPAAGKLTRSAMRRLLCLIVLCALAGLSPDLAAAGKFVQVCVKTGQLRATPNPFGKILATPGYGERVEELETSGAWQRIRYGKTEGWMHSTLLTARTSALGAGRESVDSVASSEDLTLAGKGFNAQVEAAYRRNNRALDYATIDRMDRMVVSQPQMSRFLADGGVVPEGGGQ